MILYPNNDLRTLLGGNKDFWVAWSGFWLFWGGWAVVVIVVPRRVSWSTTLLGHLKILIVLLA